MSCPTCDHTMDDINDVAAYRIFLCSRCGTVKTESYIGVPKWHVTVYVPKLVERCRVFEQEMKDESPIADVTFGVIISILRRLGIAEAINKPEERPQ